MLIVTYVRISTYQLLICTMWIIWLKLLLTPRLNELMSRLGRCKSALYVFAVAGLSDVSSLCSLLCPAWIVVKSAETFNVVLEMEKVMNNNDTGSWTPPFFQQNSISQRHFMKRLCIFLTPSISSMILYEFYQSGKARPLFLFPCWKKPSKHHLRCRKCKLWEVFSYIFEEIDTIQQRIHVTCILCPY